MRPHGRTAGGQCSIGRGGCLGRGAALVPTLRAEDLDALARACLRQVGVPADDATLIAEHLVEAGLMGHDTHSVLRLPQYVNMVRDGQVEPGAELVVLDESECGGRLSGQWNYGPVTATEAVRWALDKLGDGAVAVVGVRDCNHVARLGRFAEIATRADCISLITANGHGGDSAVAPFGGRSRRLPTNPICCGIPTGGAWPVILDMTTSMLSGGDMRLLRNRGEDAPPGMLIDAEGHPTTKVDAYYGPPAGAILPLGFPQSGHKGYGLSVLVDILAGSLSGAGMTQEAPERTGNALFIAVLNVAAFLPLNEFYAEVAGFVEWVKSCPPAPGVAEVLLPGERAHQRLQARRRDGLYVDEKAWDEIGALAAELGVELPTPVAV
ncbi:MAG: Ldh family oxidoreductase [Gemmatimonadetes bacterium]|nr:Ldh family oxidoreductase [Gemmatimonadota bacterium]MYK40059.1 Ldh family oxidoreductase [Gemmatimonadota bacterium]